MPSPEEIEKWHRWFAIELSNRAWTIAENPSRTSAEIEEMIHAAHAAALHWSKVGTDLNKALADNLLGQAHAVAGNGKQALHYAGRSYDFFAARESSDWEIAFANVVLANAARAAGETPLYNEYRAKAAASREAITDPEDREIFDRTFNQLGK
jgi:hypothetical protein